MNPKRKADIQRKLSLNAVPRPPAGLAERIKADIPKFLEIEAERRRFSGAIATQMRIAASILLLVTSLVVTIYLVSPEAEQIMAPSTAVFAPAGRDLPRAASAPTEEVRLEIAQESEIPSFTVATPPPSAPMVAPMKKERANTSDDVESDFGTAAVGVETGRVADSFAPEAPPPPVSYERQQAVETAPEPRAFAEATPDTRSRMAAPAAAERRDEAAVRESMTITASAPSLSIVRQANAAKSSLEAKKEVFGISVDPAAFQRIRTLLEDGKRPSASDVDVEALVNYFAAAAAQPPRRGVALEVEASPAAIEADGDHAVLRFTIDTAKSDGLRGGSIPPVAAEARIEVEFNDRVVARATRAGSRGTLDGEMTLLAGTSVTSIYALEMKPNLRSRQTVATIRLHYRAVPTGRTQTIVRTIKAGDLSKSWSQATRRHRLASLGAVWGETLKGNEGGDDVARRADELATQKPDDPLARALAAAANASASGGR